MPVHFQVHKGKLVSIQDHIIYFFICLFVLFFTGHQASSTLFHLVPKSGYVNLVVLGQPAEARCHNGNLSCYIPAAMYIFIFYGHFSSVQYLFIFLYIKNNNWHSLLKFEKD